MSEDNNQQDLAAQIENHHKSGAYDKALAISARALEADPSDLRAYGFRWRLIADMFFRGGSETQDSILKSPRS